MVIKRTSVVMLKCLAIARNALVVVAGIVLFGDQVSAVQAFGYAVSLFFFCVYNYLQLWPEPCASASPDDELRAPADEDEIERH